MILKHKINILVILCCLAVFIPAAGLAESPFEISYTGDSLLVAGGLNLLTIGLYFEDTKPSVLSEDRVKSLSRSEINFFDRAATYFWSPEAAAQSDFLVGTMGVLPAALFFSEKIRKDAAEISVMYLETFLYTMAAVSLAKGLVTRIRPYAYNPDISPGGKTGLDTEKSFYSGHTAAAFSSALFTGTVFSAYFPGSKWESTVWLISVSGAAAVGFLRVRAGMHYPTDVITGAVLGSLTGYLLPQFHKKNKKVSVFPAYEREQYKIIVEYKF